ncbi:MAG: metal ABC transporter permease, partial [Alphaproteobacteria bacterium]
MDWPGLLADAWAAATFRGGYNVSVVVAGTTCLGVAAGLVGSFTFLRRRALISDALSHATLPGIALAFLLGAMLGFEQRSLPLLLAGAAATGALGVLTVQLLTRHTRLGEDAAIGTVLSVFYGVGIVLLSYIQVVGGAGQAGIKSFILGQTAAMARHEAIALAALALLAAGATMLLLKEFRLVCFDAAFAEAQGWPVFRIDLLMVGLTVVVTVVGLQTVGLILIVALLILPPVAARFWTDRLSRMLALSAAFGGTAGFCGAVASAVLPNVPTGAVIVLAAGAIFVVSLAFAPRRGVVAAALGQLTLRLRLEEAAALLRLERHGTRPPPLLSARLRLWGLVDADGRPTPRGRSAARN